MPLRASCTWFFTLPSSPPASQCSSKPKPHRDPTPPKHTVEHPLPQPHNPMGASTGRGESREEEPRSGTSVSLLRGNHHLPRDAEGSRASGWLWARYEQTHLGSCHVTPGPRTPRESPVQRRKQRLIPRVLRVTATQPGATSAPRPLPRHGTARHGTHPWLENPSSPNARQGPFVRAERPRHRRKPPSSHV